MNRREQILSSVRSVRSLPTAAVEVVRLLQDPELTIADLAQTIEYDPALTSNVLRLANSAYFGCARSIGSVRDAIVRLGTNKTFRLAVASAFAPLARQAVKGYDLPPGELWKHSIAVALGAERLAEVLGRKGADYAFTAGLLHDIGKLVLGNFVEVDAAPLAAMAFQERVSFEVTERRVLGIDHAEVGAVLLEGWNLPPCVVRVVRWHHVPGSVPGEDTSVVDLVHVADNLSMTSGIGTGIDGLNYCPSSEVMSRLHLTTRLAEGVLCEIMGGLDELHSLPGADTGR